MTNKQPSRLINHVLKYFHLYWAAFLALLIVVCLLLAIPDVRAAQQDLNKNLGPSKTCIHNCSVDSLGYALIKNFEGYYPFIYKDVAGISTIGFGHALLKTDHFETPLMGPAAETLLEYDVNTRTPILNRLITKPLSARQFDAISSFHYNLGTKVLAGSLLLKYINAGNYAAAVPLFTHYDHVGKTVSKGLYMRRKSEATMFASDL